MLLYVYCCTAICSTVHHVWSGIPHAHDDVVCSCLCCWARLYGVCVICMFTVVVYTWLGVCSLGGRNKNPWSEKHMIRTIDAKVLNPNGANDGNDGANGSNIFVQNGDDAHNNNNNNSSSERQVIHYYTEQAPKKSTSHSSTAQMDVPHTHGVTCWWCCWAAVFLTLMCSLRVGCAHGCVHERAKKTERMLMLPLGLVRAQRV